MRYVLIVFLIITLFGCDQKNERIQARKGSIIQSVYASIIVQPDSLYAVYASVSGIVDIIYVQEGEAVQKDQPLLQIINSTPSLNVQNAQLTLGLSRENYQKLSQKLNNEVEIARLRYNQDSINFYRQKRLWEQNVGTQNQFDERKLAFQIAEKSLTTLKKEYDRTISELKIQVQQAEINYETTKIKANDFVVTCNMNGRVYSLQKESGENVLPQEPLATIGSRDSFIIKMLVDEVDITRLKLNQRVLLTMEAFGDEVFEAKVIKIYPKKDERTQTFSVEADFTKPPSKLYAGLAGEANIIVAQKKNTLIIPRSYLVNDSTVKTEKAEMTIKTGLYNLDEIEIISGIDSGTFIYKP